MKHYYRKREFDEGGGGGGGYDMPRVSALARVRNSLQNVVDDGRSSAANAAFGAGGAVRRNFWPALGTTGVVIGSVVGSVLIGTAWVVLKTLEYTTRAAGAVFGAVFGGAVRSAYPSELSGKAKAAFTIAALAGAAAVFSPVFRETVGRGFSSIGSSFGKMGHRSGSGARARPQTGAGELALAPGTAEKLNAMSPEDIFYKGILIQESGGKQFNANGSVVTSNKDARGAAQVLPSTAGGMMGYTKEDMEDPAIRQKVLDALADPETNKAMGLQTLKANISHFHDNTLGILGYNSGSGRVDDWINGKQSKWNPSGVKLGDPRTGETTYDAFMRAAPIKESRNYVPGVARNLGLEVIKVGGDDNYAQYVDINACPQIAAEMQYVGLYENRDSAVLNGFINGGVDPRLRLDVAKPEDQWCMGILNAGERTAGYSGTGSNLATSVENYGVKIPKGQQKICDIVELTSEFSHSGMHVGRFVGRTPDGRPLLYAGNSTWGPNGAGSGVDVKPYDEGKVNQYRRSQ